MLGAVMLGLEACRCSEMPAGQRGGLAPSALPSATVGLIGKISAAAAELHPLSGPVRPWLGRPLPLSGRGLDLLLIASADGDVAWTLPSCECCLALAKLPESLATSAGLRRLSGQVIDGQSGRPLAGVIVALIRAGSQGHWLPAGELGITQGEVPQLPNDRQPAQAEHRAQTDQNGLFSLEVPAQGWLSLHHPGFAPLRVLLDGRRTLRLELRRMQTLSCVVRDADGHTVSDLQTQTNAQSAAETEFEGDRLLVRWRDAAAAPSIALRGLWGEQPLDVARLDRPCVVELALHRVALTLLERQSGASVERLRVRLAKRSRELSAPGGRLRLSLPAGLQTIWLSPPQLVPQRLRLVVGAGGIEHQTVVFDQAGRLSGRLLRADGRAVIGATVQIGGQSCTTAADGSFAFEALPYGSHQVSVWTKGGRKVKLSDTVSVRAARNDPVDLYLPLVAQ